MKQSEINNLSETELKTKLSQLRKAYTDLKSAHAISPITNPLQIRSTRRAIARVITELTKRELH
jgi:large subunit ribosomal protein L29